MSSQFQHLTQGLAHRRSLVKVFGRKEDREGGEKEITKRKRTPIDLGQSSLLCQCRRSCLVNDKSVCKTNSM